MNEHRYILEPYKGMNTRYRCPECNKGKTFVRYIDIETGVQLANHVGKCNRLDNCSYHYKPKQYFQDNGISYYKPQPRQFYKPKATVTPPLKPVSLIGVKEFKASLKNYEENSFVKFLLALFGSEISGQLISKYFIGSSKHWPGANVFWQIDNVGKVRTGKIMLYDSTTGRRVKEPYNHITWVHKALKLTEYELRQCFFGEHLLKDKAKPVAIVESEKTAIISSIFLPQFIWIAAGSKEVLNLDKCQVLKGRNVTLFPDLNGFEKWSKKAKEFSHIARFTVSDLLERKASEAERGEGLDLADYLIRYDYKQFVLQETANKPVAAFQKELLNIHSKDVLSKPVKTFLHNQYNESLIETVITDTGIIEILRNKNGELLQPENEQLVNDISTFYAKQFQAGTLDGVPAFINILNN